MDVLSLAWARPATYGGIQGYQADLNEALSRLGVRIHRFELPTLPTRGEAAADDGRRASLLRQFAAEMDGFLRHTPVDVIDGHNLHFDIDVLEAVVIAARPHRTVVLNRIHDLPGPRMTLTPDVTAALERIDGAVHFVVTSPYNARRFEALMGRPPLAIIPPGIDFDRFIRYDDPEPGTVSCPGRLTPAKGLIDAVAVVGELAAERGGLRLLLSDRTQGAFGESAEFFAELERTLAAYPALDWAFVREPDSIPRIYLRATVTLFMPLVDEGFGAMPLESLASGRPVVAVPTGGMEWMTGVPGTVLLPSRDRDGVKRALASVLDRPARFLAAARDARANLRGVYDVRVNASQYASLYEQLAARTSPSKTRRDAWGHRVGSW